MEEAAPGHTEASMGGETSLSSRGRSAQLVVSGKVPMIPPPLLCPPMRAVGAPGHDAGVSSSASLTEPW